MQRFYAIVNPVAGGGAARRAWTAVRPVLESVGEVEMAETRGRGHAAELAESAARAGWPAIIALGGDGTVHEAANGLLRAVEGDAETAALGVIPVGSGNDFAVLAGLPRDPVAAVRRVVEGGERRIDVGRLDGRWFTNGVGIGLDARVAIEADRSRRGKGMGMYLLALARVLRAFRAPRMRVEIDGEVMDRPLTLVTVGNGGRHGGGFWLCPDARIDDGVLDVCVCDGLSRPRMLALLPRTLRGTHVGASCVHMRRARRVRVTSASPLPVHADGEVLFEDAHDLTIEIVPARLRLLG